MHKTVLRHGQIALQRCQSCCLNYHCPYCGPKVFKPTRELHVVENHVRNHLSLAVQHEEFLIVKCNLLCREQAHFHCCYCPNTVIRKVQIVKHLALCKKRQVPPTEPVTVEPVVINKVIDPRVSLATSEPIVPSALLAFKEPAVAKGVSLPVKNLRVPKKMRIQTRVQCVHCGITINKKNLDVHVKRKHTEENLRATSSCYM